jgi:hypothetical protein
MAKHGWLKYDRVRRPGYCGLAGVQQAITGFGSLLRAI